VDDASLSVHIHVVLLLLLLALRRYLCQFPMCCQRSNMSNTTRRPIRRPDTYLRLETEGGSDFAVLWP